MAEPIRIRAKVHEGMTNVVVLMPHPMETGLRHDEAGRAIAPHYITNVSISVSGRAVLSARLSFAMAKDPLLSFHFVGGVPGERLRVAWRDSRGDERVDETLIV